MGGSSASAGDGGFQQEPTRSTLSKRNQAKVDRKNKKEANVEMGLGNDRMSNYSTSQGGTKEEGDGNGNNNIQTTNTYNGGGGDGGQDNNNSNITQATKKKSPTVKTTVETKVEKAADLTAEQILLRNKKRGRASSIMTSSQGVGKTSSNYELGKTSLLGRV